VVALRAGAATDVGLVRSNNQDSFLVADPLYAVADGMGGAAAGEVASALAIEALNNGFSSRPEEGVTADLLVRAARTANRAVWDEADANPEMRGMGTTLVAVALVEGPELAIINIGDSRLYQLHDDELRQVTFDHNLVAEMVAEGRITPAEAEVHPRRNIMTRALGVEPEVPVDLFTEEPHPGDRYLLCSDGLPREVNDDLIASYLRRFADPSEAARELVEEAKRRGGNDNITVVVVDVVDVVGEVDPAGDGAAVDAAADSTTALPAAPVASVAPVAPVADTPPTATGPTRRTRSVITVRVVAFVLVVLLIIAGAVVGIVWYARSSYFVGLRGSQIVIYQGRPGGVLGINPTLEQTTNYTTADVLPAAVPALRSGQEEPSMGAARTYVTSLVQAYQAAQAAAAPPTTVAPPTTAKAVPTTAKP
jgi:serine/threonine protein phosphatase PrpC